MDTLNLLEKRVKSRFSGRLIRVSPPSSFEEYVGVAKTILQASLTSDEILEVEEEEELEEWMSSWNQSIAVSLTKRFSGLHVADMTNKPTRPSYQTRRQTEC